MGQMHFFTNNGGAAKLLQAREDGDVYVTYSLDDTRYRIKAEEMVMLLNYYRAAKQGYVASEFIAPDKKKEG